MNGFKWVKYTYKKQLKKKKKKMNEQVHGTSYKTNIEKLKNIKITILETIYKYSNGTVEWVINYLYLWNGV